MRAATGPPTYAAAVTVPREQPDSPPLFRAALDALAAVVPRHEVIVEEGPAPQRLARHAVTLTADVVVDDIELGTGRFVLLHEPDGHETWDGSFRIVTFIRAGVDPEMAADPFASAVGWSWLTDALAAHGCPATMLGGTVTRVSSESFGELDERPAEAHLEIRASWTPPMLPAGRLADHFAAWVETLCQACGLAPLPPGVTPIPSQHRRG